MDMNDPSTEPIWFVKRASQSARDTVMFITRRRTTAKAVRQDLWLLIERAKFIYERRTSPFHNPTFNCNSLNRAGLRTLPVQGANDIVAEENDEAVGSAVLQRISRDGVLPDVGLERIEYRNRIVRLIDDC
jgi:hypothetical protein